MHSGAVRFWLLLIAALGAGYASLVLVRRVAPEPSAPQAASPTASAPAEHARAADETLPVGKTPPVGEVAPFELTDESGQPFDSKSLEGKVWVASFFFTNCPGVCWRMNRELAGWQHTHPDSDIRFVSITCDPDNDTPEALARYAKHFKADPKRWTFLTGDMQTIQDIGQESFQIAVVKGDHTDRACVVDRQGRIRGRFRLTEPDQVAMLNLLLAKVEAEPAEKPAASERPAESASTGAPAEDTEKPAAENADAEQAESDTADTENTVTTPSDSDTSPAASEPD